MYVVIEPRYEDPIVRQILPHEILDGDAFAASYAAQCGQELSHADEEIPDGSGDFRITIKDEPPTPWWPRFNPHLVRKRLSFCLRRRLISFP